MAILLVHSEGVCLCHDHVFSRLAFIGVEAIHPSIHSKHTIKGDGCHGEVPADLNTTREREHESRIDPCVSFHYRAARKSVVVHREQSKSKLTW